MKNTYQKETVKKVLQRIARYKLYLAVSLVCAVITVAATLYLPIMIGDTIDCMTEAGKVDFAAIWAILVKIAAVIGITAAAQWLMNICNNKIAYQVTRDIRNEAIQKIEILPLKYIDGHSYGDTVSRVIADVDQFADGLIMGFTQLFTGVMTIIGTLGFMFAINPYIALVVVVLTPVSLFVAAFISKRTYTMFRLQSETRGEQTAYIDEMINGQKVVRAFGQMCIRDRNMC